MSKVIEEFLKNKLEIRNTLSSIYNREVVDYLMKLIVNDSCHYKTDEYIKEDIVEVKEENTEDK